MAKVLTTPETRDLLNSFHPEMVGRIMPEVAQRDIAVFRPDDMRLLLSETEQMEFDGWASSIEPNRQIEFVNRLLGLLPGDTSFEFIDNKADNDPKALLKAEQTFAKQVMHSLGSNLAVHIQVAQYNDILERTGLVLKTEVDSFVFLKNSASQEEMGRHFIEGAGLGDPDDPEVIKEFEYMFDKIPLKALYVHGALHEAAHSPQDLIDKGLFEKMNNEMGADYTAIPKYMTEFNKTSGVDSVVDDMKFIEHSRALNIVNMSASGKYDFNAFIDINEDMSVTQYDTKGVYPAKLNVLSAMFVAVRSVCAEDEGLKAEMESKYEEFNAKYGDSLVKDKEGMSATQKGVLSDNIKANAILKAHPEMHYVALKALVDKGYFENGTAEHEMASEYVEAVEALLPHYSENERAQILLAKASKMDDIFSNASVNGDDLKKMLVDGGKHPLVLVSGEGLSDGEPVEVVKMHDDVIALGNSEAAVSPNLSAAPKF